MQFKIIGEILSIEKSNTGLPGIIKALNGLDEATQVSVLSMTKLSNAEKIAALSATLGSKAAAEQALGITSVGTASTTATVGVTGLGAALKGLWASNPFLVIAMGASVAITAITGISSAINNYKQEQLSAAKQAASAWSEQNDSLQSQIDKISELRTALDNGTLSEEEAYTAKSELLSIQQQLNSQYGDAVAGIDLMNGSLKEQIQLLNEASKASAEKFLNENRKGNAIAKKEMKKSRDTYLGEFSQNWEDADKLQGIIDKYTDKGISTMTDDAMGEVYVYFNGDASQAEEVLNNLMTDLRNASEETGNIDLFDQFIENASVGLKDAKSVIETYGDTYNEIRQAEMLTSDKEYKVDDQKAQTASKWLKDYADAINNYNEALISGDSKKIDEAASSFEAVDKAVQALLDQTSMSEWSDQFEEFRSQLNDSGIAYQDFYDKVSGYDLSDNNINSYIEDLKKLNLTDVDFKYAFETDGVQDGEESIQGLATAAENAGISVETLVDILKGLGIISSQNAEGVDEITSSAESVSSSIESFVETQDKLNAAMAASVSASGLTAEQISDVADAYSELDGYNPSKLFEVTANGVHLNTQALRDLQAQQENVVKSDINDKISEQNQLLEESRQKLQELLRTGASQSDILSAEADISGIQAEIEALMQLQAQFDGATSAYQRWLDAQSGGEEGDMYDSFQTVIERGDELLKSGLVGTNEFRAIADLFSNQDLSTAPIDQLVEAYNNASPIIKSFFTEGEKGANNFIDKMIEMGYATEDAQTGLIDFSNTDTQSIADSLGIDVEAVEAIFKKLNDYGWEIDLGNISATGIDDISNSIDAAKQRLDEINNYNATATIKVDATGDEQIQETAQLLASLPEETQIQIGIEETGNVDSILNQLATKPDSIQVPVELSDETKTVTVNEELGETVDEVPPATGTANFELGFSPLKLPDAFGTANFRLGDYPKSLPTITQTILMKKIGESSGTMLSPAHADGNVALKHDEVALSNEQGQESIVRDGVWRLLPPGTHTEHFKKNDIIFNAAQTKQLLKNGKISGYGRTISGAYADGTYNGMPARASLYASGKRPGSYSSSTSTSTSTSSSSTTSNTDAVNANTVATNKNTKSKAKATKTLKKLQESFSKIFDWIEVKLDRLQRDIDMAETKADNSVGYQAKNANLSNAQSITKALIQTNNKGATEYFNYAKKVQKQYDSLSNKQFSKDNKKAFDDAVKIIQNGGDLKISSYNEDVRAAIEEYQKWYDKGIKTVKNNL